MDQFPKEINTANEVTEQTIDLFKTQLALCNPEHVTVCDCQKDKVDKVIAQGEKELQQQIEEEDLPPYVIESRRANIRQKARNIVGKRLEKQNVRCPVEKQLINDVIRKFDQEQDGMYDLNNSNVFLILKALVNQLLSSHRMQLYSDHHGVVQEQYDSDGNRYLTLNPVEKAKLDFDKAIVSAVDKLNSIVYGNKQLNLNVDADGDSMVEFMEHMREMRN